MITYRYLALAGASLISTITPAAAQDTAPQGAASTTGSDEIIVQARRRDESAQDVPLVVQAVTAEGLQKLQIRDFKDIQTLVPGLSMGQDNNGIGTRTTLRGVAYDVNASGNNGTVEFYMNDAPVSSAVLFQSMFDVGQIEVLRGPQGTLRGRASPSGSITVTTHRPNLSEAGGYLTGSVNDVDGWNVTGAINVPVISDKLAVRVAGMVDENDENFAPSINSPAKPRQENRGIRASVLFEPIDNLSLFFAYTNSYRKAIGFDQVESANLADPSNPASPVLIRPTDRKGAAGFPRTYNQTFEVYNWQAGYRLLGQKLDYAGSVSKTRTFSAIPSDPGGLFAGFGDEITKAGLATFNFATQKTHEIRLSSDERVGGMFDYVVGYLYNDVDGLVNLVNDTLIFGGAPSPATYVRTVKTPISRIGVGTEKSFFANVTAHLGEKAEISGGIRRIKFHNVGSLSIGGVIQPAANDDSKFRATIYSATGKYRFSPEFMAYASFGTSWRAGSSTNATIQRNNVFPSPEQAALYFAPPEKSKSFEVGLKSDLFDRRLRLNVSAYHQTFKNFNYFARNIFLGGKDAAGNGIIVPVTGIAAVVPAKVDGIEGEFQFTVTPNWNIGGTVAYSKSKIKNGRVPCNDYAPKDGISDSVVPTLAQITAATGAAGIAFCNINTRAGLTAPFSSVIQSEYNLPLSSSLDGYGRALVTYNGNSQNDPTNLIDDIKAYALVNLYAGVRGSDSAWDIGLYVKNVFDTERVLTRNGTPAPASFNGSSAASRYRVITMTQPREFGVTARIAFGSR